MYNQWQRHFHYLRNYLTLEKSQRNNPAERYQLGGKLTQIMISVLRSELSWLRPQGDHLTKRDDAKVRLF